MENRDAEKMEEKKQRRQSIPAGIKYLHRLASFDRYGNRC